MQSLSDLGYGKLHNEVFYKSPNPSKEMMKVYDIEIEQYLYKLEDSTTPKRCAFPKSLGTEHCMALYHLFMDTKDPKSNKWFPRYFFLRQIVEFQNEVGCPYFILRILYAVNR